MVPAVRNWRGEIVCVVGPSGCGGKTTTVRVAAGLIAPTGRGVLPKLGRKGLRFSRDGRTFCEFGMPAPRENTRGSLLGFGQTVEI